MGGATDTDRVITLVRDWRPLWPWVEVGLNHIVSKTRPTWIAADVYAELKAGVAVLMTLADERGFAVVKQLQDYDGPVMFVWALWGQDLAPIQDEIQAEMEKLARDAGCKRIQMRSPRKGWGRVGWTERETVYERDLWAADQSPTR